MEARFETFTVQIAKISRCIRKIKTEETAEWNLKSPHVSCLYYLYKQNGGLTAKQLCDLCDEDKAAVSRSIEFLETSGLIACESAAKKRYKSPLSLTEAGNTIAKKIADKIDGMVEKAGAGLSEADRLVFYRALRLISDNLQGICESYEE